MKKHSILFLYGACLFFLFSCSKENNSSENTDPNKVKTYTERVQTDEGTLNVVFNLNYDNKGRIISMVSADSPDDKFLYSYLSDNKVAMDIVNTQGGGSIHEDIFLNGSLIDSTFQYNDEDDYTTEKYLYNSDKQLTKIRSYSYSASEEPGNPAYTSFTYNSNGDVQKIDNEDGSTETLEYYTDLKGPLPKLMPYSGTPQQIYLIKKHNTYYGSYLYSSVDFTYTFDSRNRMTSMVETYDSGEIATRLFTYFD